MRKSLMRPRAPKTKASEWTLLRLGLRIIKVIKRSLMINDKRRDSFPTLLSAKTRISESGCIITRTKPYNVYWPLYREKCIEKKSGL
jgi:hypothetical protein